jgi:hypothetical protein
MKHRERAMTEETAIQLLMEHGGAAVPSSIAEEAVGTRNFASHRAPG